MNEFNKAFLYGPLRIDRNWGMMVRFEYIHDLILEANIKNSDVSDEDILRTPEFLLGKNFCYSISCYFGM